MEDGEDGNAATQDRKHSFPLQNNVSQKKTTLNELSENRNF